MRRVLYYEEKLTPKALISHFPLFLPFAHSFFPKPSPLYPSKLANKALVYISLLTKNNYAYLKVTAYHQLYIVYSWLNYSMDPLSLRFVTDWFFKFVSVFDLVLLLTKQ